MIKLHIYNNVLRHRGFVSLFDFTANSGAGSTTELNKLSREIANDENQYEENWLKIAANFVSGQLPTFQLKINNVIFEIADSGDLKWNETK